MKVELKEIIDHVSRMLDLPSDYRLMVLVEKEKIERWVIVKKGQFDILKSYKDLKALVEGCRDLFGNKKENILYSYFSCANVKSIMKPGDIIWIQEHAYTWLSIINRWEEEDGHLVLYSSVSWCLETGYYEDRVGRWGTLDLEHCDCAFRLATEEEKQDLFLQMEKKGVQWNPKKGVIRLPLECE